jgi:hypothetical protein
MNTAAERIEQVRPVSFCLARPWEAGTLAFVHADCYPWYAPLEVKRAMERACTRWVTQTEAGRSEWESNKGDFNIGDITLSLGDTELLAFLREEGIYSITIMTTDEDPDYEDFDNHEDERQWAFDDCLVDREQVAA